MNPDYMHWYGRAAVEEPLQKIKDGAEKLRAKKTTALNIGHRVIRVRQDIGLTSEGVSEFA
jgi:hypothetical protein